MANDLDPKYEEITRVDRLPDQDPIEGVPYYEIREDGTIFVSPSTIPVTIRVRGEFIPDELNNLTDSIMVGARNALVYATAALIAGVRGMALAAALDAKAKDAADTLENRLVKKRQKVPLRIGNQRRSTKRTAIVML
jgi:hypothetical protein